MERALHIEPCAVFFQQSLIQSDISRNEGISGGDHCQLHRFIKERDRVCYLFLRHKGGGCDEADLFGSQS